MYLGINDMGREIVHVSEAPVNDELKGNMEHHHGKKKEHNHIRS